MTPGDGPRQRKTQARAGPPSVPSLKAPKEHAVILLGETDSPVHDADQSKRLSLDQGDAHLRRVIRVLERVVHEIIEQEAERVIVPVDPNRPRNIRLKLTAARTHHAFCAPEHST
jgi:hypothetical protein